MGEASPSAIRAVLLDMDGLIVDTEPIHFQAFRAMMREYGHEIEDSIMPSLVGLPEAQNIRDLKRMYKISASEEGMGKRRYRLFMQLIRVEPIPVLPGFWELAEQVRRRGIKLAVVSSSAAEQVAVILGRVFAERRRPAAGEPSACEPGHYFDAIVSGDDIESNKPAPDIYLHAAERLQVAPRQCLVFEDTPPGVRAGAAAGMTVIAVPNRYSQGLCFPGARAVICSLEKAIPYLDL